MSKDKSSAVGLTTGRDLLPGPTGITEFVLEDAFGTDEPASDEPDFSQALAAARGMAHGAAAKLLHAELRRAGPRAHGPKTCAVLLALGILEFELGQSAAAGSTFERGLAMAQDVADQRHTGSFLHELSIVAWHHGDHAKAAVLARDSLAVKLAAFHATAALTGTARLLRHGNEPFQAIERLASMLAVLQRWDEADALLACLLNSCSARNDIPGLVRTLVAHAVAAIGQGRRADAEHRLGRAVWAGRISGIDVDALFSAHGFAFTQPALEGCPVQSDCRGREALEQSLIAQYREIALGLLADRLLRNDDLSELAWWQQFCSQRRAPPPYMEDAGDEEFAAFQDEIFQSVTSGRIKRINPGDLPARKIKINGGDIFCWQDGTINRHLAEIGSSLRLFVAGSDVARAASVLTMLGHTPAVPVDCSDFILGEVRPVTTLGKACLFDFGAEYAVSPHLNAVSAGLHDEGRVVLRQVLVGRVGEYTKQRRPALEALIAAGPDEARAIQAARAELRLHDMSDEQCRRSGRTQDELCGDSLLSHELGHVLQRFPIGTGGPFASWRAIVRDDLCRFTQVPRTLPAILAAFRRISAGLGEPAQYGFFLTAFPPGDSPAASPLETIVAGLLSEGLLRRLPGGALHFAGFVGRA